MKSFIEFMMRIALFEILLRVLKSQMYESRLGSKTLKEKKKGFSLLRDSFSFIRYFEKVSLLLEKLPRECFSFIQESASLFREGFSFIR